MIQEKIKTREALALLCKELRKEGKSIGFTSGVFDLLHAGHVDYLEKAKALCDVLIVGVNSDASVRSYKGQSRPIVSQDQRIKVLAALESVNYVFLFEERRNQKNIEVLKPDIYIKAGDYSPDTLTSKAVIEKLGGRIYLIPIAESTSTTALIEKILSVEKCERERFVEEEGAVHIERIPSKLREAVFLDRDGTMIEEIEYLHEPEKIRFLPHALEGIKQFQNMGYRLIILTNQPGIGLGYYTKEDFYRVNKAMFKEFSKHGILIDKIYFCPHSKAENCSCRKPGQALIQRAQKELMLDLSRSIMIGDKTADIETGKRAGMKTILVRTGHQGKDEEYAVQSDYVAEDLLSAAQWILEKQRSGK